MKNLLVACYNPSSTMTRYKQQYVSGQSQIFPALNSTTYYLECVSGFNWTDGQLVKSIHCSNNKWGRIPTPCKCTKFDCQIHYSIQKISQQSFFMRKISKIFFFFFLRHFDYSTTLHFLAPLPYLHKIEIRLK